MKKILVIHNKYRLTGGEDIAVNNEINVLKKYFNVKVLYFENIVSNYVVQLLYFLINKNYKSINLIKKEIEVFNPDVVYFHNTWFKVSPGIFSELLKANKKIFLKIHNYRFNCTKYFFTYKHIKKNEYCKGCGLNRNELGIFNKYFSHSYLQSLFVIIYGIKFFKILKYPNLKILTLTNFQKSFLINSSISKEKIFIHRNIIDISNEIYQLKPLHKNTIVYAGRISKEKGIENLINAFLKSSLNKTFTFNIIGNGPELESLIKNYSFENIKFFGQLNNKQTLKIISEAKAVVTSTKLYEGQPTLLCEASVLGVPSIFPINDGINEFFPKNYQLTYDLEIENSIVNTLDKLIHINSKEIGETNRNYIKNLINEENYIKNFKTIINTN